MEKNITIYDNMGETLDRITIVFNDEIERVRNGVVEYNSLASSETGLGFFMHTTAVKGEHLGKEIEFSDLHPELKMRMAMYFKAINE